MKTLAFAVLSLVSVFAMADENVSNVSGSQAMTQTEKYNQHKGLDIAKVISSSTAQDPQNVDGPVKAQMVYVDGSGVRHSLDYTILGYGRQNG
jgi:uncharacterized protein YdeI (BOF family)